MIYLLCFISLFTAKYIAYVSMLLVYYFLNFYSG